MKVFLRLLIVTGMFLPGLVWGLEKNPVRGKVIYGGGIARNVVISQEGYEFILMANHAGKATGWSLKVKKGEDVQEQEIRKKRKNIFRFGEEVIEVENESVVPSWKESKFMMAETVGEFQIVLKYIKGSKSISFQEADFGGLKSLVIGNQAIEMEVIPEKKGAIVTFIDKTTGVDFIYLPLGRDMKTCKGSAGQGMIELLGGLNAVIDDEMVYQVKREADKLIIILEGSYGDDVKVGRRMEFRDNFSGVDISSWIKPNKRGEHWLRHRAEMRLGGDIGGGDVFYSQGKGEIKKKFYRGGQSYFKGSSWLIGVDEEKKIGLVSVYEPENFETLYVYMGGNFFTWEAWTGKTILEKAEYLKLNARYFIIRGLDGVNNVTKHGVIHIKTGKDCYDIGEAVNMEIGAGLCQPEDTDIIWQVEDGSGRVYASGKRKFFCSPGEMKYIKINWNAEKDGEYLCEVEVRENGKEILRSAKSILVSGKQIKELKQKEEELITRMEELRKNWQINKTSGVKNELFRLEEIRIQLEEYKKSGQGKKALKILREAFSSIPEQL